MTKKIYIINANYYEEISNRLISGAIAYLNKIDLSYEIVNVPGALEIPSAINIINNNLNSNDFDIGFIAIGCVIRGETSHYDIVARQSAEGLIHLSLTQNIIISDSILTVENKKQALDRSLEDSTNKGYHAANACCRLLDIKNGNL
ncbi:MAG: 6,7-dimethyl-8-ribityllumazine synthase [Rhodobiaceae bacterium]|nr:6,7-dimethyl-8-ribityllumazine synthase [Rhodobiaceae bacterium]